MRKDVQVSEVDNLTGHLNDLTMDHGKVDVDYDDFDSQQE